MNPQERKEKWRKNCLQSICGFLIAFFHYQNWRYSAGLVVKPLLYEVRQHEQERWVIT